MFTTVFHDLLSKNFYERKNHPAIIEHGNTYTYDQLNNHVEKLAAWMYERGVRRGDRVGIYLYKSFEEVIAMFAAARLGAVFVNINYQWTLQQLNYVINDCQISFLTMDESRAVELASQKNPDFLRSILVKGKSPENKNFFNWTEFNSPPLPEELTCIDVDLAAILYTSGSTGKPKGVMLTNLNLIQGARSVGKYLKNNKDDRVISVLPFSFDYGLNQLTTMFLVGGTIVLQSVMMPSEIIKSIKQNEVTGFAAVPPTWVAIVRYLLEVPNDFPKLRYITNSGGKIPNNILESMKKVLPNVDIFLMYGLTESFRSTYLSPELFNKKMGSMGKAIPNSEIFIINPDKGICGPGDHGELVHRGSLVSKGYWGKNESTAEKIKTCPELKHLIGDEKVVYSGDIVKIDEDGFFWFISRVDSLIKSTGFRISPQEVEEIVMKFGNVSEVVAFGVNDDTLGQVVHVAISTLNGKPLIQSEFLKYCRENMPHYMVPKVMHHYIGQMPRTSSGKIDVPNVVKQFKNE